MSFGAKECQYCILEFHFLFTSNHICNCKSISFQNETEENFLNIIQVQDMTKNEHDKDFRDLFCS